MVDLLLRLAYPALYRARTYRNHWFGEAFRFDGKRFSSLWLLTAPPGWVGRQGTPDDARAFDAALPL